MGRVLSEDTMCYASRIPTDPIIALTVVTYLSGGMGKLIDVRLRKEIGVFPNNITTKKTNSNILLLLLIIIIIIIMILLLLCCFVNFIFIIIVIIYVMYIYIYIYIYVYIYVYTYNKVAEKACEADPRGAAPPHPLSFLIIKS